MIKAALAIPVSILLLVLFNVLYPEGFVLQSCE
jgi:hypothetical protein